jgi:hypothetical protein
MQHVSYSLARGRCAVCRGIGVILSQTLAAYRHKNIVLIQSMSAYGFTYEWGGYMIEMAVAYLDHLLQNQLRNTPLVVVIIL